MQKKQKTIFLLLEWIWLGVIILCLGIALRESYFGNWREALIWVFLLAIAAIMFWVRRSKRLSIEKENDSKK